MMSQSANSRAGKYGFVCEQEISYELGGSRSMSIEPTLEKHTHIREVSGSLMPLIP